MRPSTRLINLSCPRHNSHKGKEDCVVIFKSERERWRDEGGGGGERKGEGGKEEGEAGRRGEKRREGETFMKRFP